MGWFSTKWCCSCKKTVRSRQNSFKEQNEFTTLTMLLDPRFSNITDSLTNLQFFYHLLLCGDFAQSWRSSTMKTLTVAPSSFQKLTQFTVLNKLQEALACNINASLTWAAVLLPFTWTGRFSRKLMLLIQENGESYAYSCEEQTKFTILTKLLEPLVSNIKGFS
jgi:hypothetical protein